MPTPEVDWDRVADLFHAARELPPAERDAWLAERVAERSDVLAEVRSLLAADARHEALSAEAAPPAPPALEGYAESVSDDPPPGRYGPYQTGRLLGRGGMGAVYLARRVDGHFDQTVALKVIGSQLAGPDAVRRFQAERQILASLNHPNITRLLDGGVSASGVPYLVMEYVEGEPFDRHCDTAKLTIEQRLRLFLSVCDAVDYAHRSLVLHRDLKPGNVLVDRSGAVKLLDFGTASVLAEAGTDVTVTRARMLTPRYASPEMLRGERATVACDVYSLGVVLFELLTGHWPFGDPGSLVSELKRATGDSAPTRPATAVTEDAASLRSLSVDRLRRLVAGDLSAIVLKALAHAPERRYLSIRQLADDLAAFLDGRPVQARPQSPAYRLGKFLRRHWVPAAAVAAIVATVAGAAAIAWNEAVKARREAVKAEQVNAFLVGMLSSAGNLDFDPKQRTVAQMLDAAAARLAKTQLDDPLANAVLHRSLALSYYTLIDHDKASSHVDQALATLRTAGDPAELADALRLRGMIGSQRGQAEEATQDLEAGLAILDGLGSRARPLQVFRLKCSLAFHLSLMRNIEWERAGRLFQQALALADDPSIPRTEVAEALAGWASVLEHASRTQEAEEVLLQALAAGRQEQPGGAWEFPVLFNLAQIASRRSDFAVARDYAQQMVDVSSRNLGADGGTAAQATMTWARYAARSGQLAEAVAGVDRAMPIIEKLYSTTSTVRWVAARNAALVMRMAGRLEDSERYARDSLVVTEATHMPEDDPRLANSLEELGLTLCALGKTGEGLPALRSAEASYRKAGPRWVTRADETLAAIAKHTGR